MLRFTIKTIKADGTLRFRLPVTSLESTSDRVVTVKQEQVRWECGDVTIDIVDWRYVRFCRLSDPI